MEDRIAKIQSWVYEDRLTGNRMEVRVSPQYSTIHVNDRVYYFVRETGEFDGTSTPMGERD